MIVLYNVWHKENLNTWYSFFVFSAKAIYYKVAEAAWALDSDLRINY